MRAVKNDARNHGGEPALPGLPAAEQLVARLAEKLPDEPRDERRDVIR